MGNNYIFSNPFYFACIITILKNEDHHFIFLMHWHWFYGQYTLNSYRLVLQNTSEVSNNRQPVACLSKVVHLLQRSRIHGPAVFHLHLPALLCHHGHHHSEWSHGRAHQTAVIHGLLLPEYHHLQYARALDLGTQWLPPDTGLCGCGWEQCGTSTGSWVCLGGSLDVRSKERKVRQGWANDRNRKWN